MTIDTEGNGLVPPGGPLSASSLMGVNVPPPRVLPRIPPALVAPIALLTIALAAVLLASNDTCPRRMTFKAGFAVALYSISLAPVWRRFGLVLGTAVAVFDVGLVGYLIEGVRAFRLMACG